MTSSSTGARSLVTGDMLDPWTTLGPLISAGQLEITLLKKDGLRPHPAGVLFFRQGQQTYCNALKPAQLLDLLNYDLVIFRPEK